MMDWYFTRRIIYSGQHPVTGAFQTLSREKRQKLFHYVAILSNTFCYCLIDDCQILILQLVSVLRIPLEKSIESISFQRLFIFDACTIHSYVVCIVSLRLFRTNRSINLHTIVYKRTSLTIIKGRMCVCMRASTSV